MSISGRRVLITGGSSGIGKATAALLKDAGAQVAITARGRDRLKTAAEEAGALAIQADVSNPEDVQRTYRELEEALGGLDVLINNAAVGGRGELAELDAARMEEIWRINVFGAALMAKEAAKRFIAQSSGAIINVASTAALRGYAGGSMYASSKFALRGLSECWRAELRPHNVRVTTICPSEVTTAFGAIDGRERPEQSNRLRSLEIAHAIKSCLEMDERGFIPELSVFATNPWQP